MQMLFHSQLPGIETSDFVVWINYRLMIFNRIVVVLCACNCWRCAKCRQTQQKCAALNSSFGWGGIVPASINRRTSSWGELAGYWATLIRGTERALTPRYFNPNLCHRLMNIQRGVFLSSNDIRSLTPVKPTPTPGCLSSKVEWADYFCPVQWNVRRETEGYVETSEVDVSPLRSTDCSIGYDHWSVIPSEGDSCKHVSTPRHPFSFRGKIILFALSSGKIWARICISS